MVVQCCVCKRVHLEDTWEVATDPSVNATASHGYCPSCLDQAYAEFRAVQRNVAAVSAAPTAA